MRECGNNMNVGNDMNVLQYSLSESLHHSMKK